MLKTGEDRLLLYIVTINNNILLLSEGEVDVHLGEYLPRFTEPGANSCFSIISRGKCQKLQTTT